MRDLSIFTMDKDEHRLAIFEIAAGDGYSSIVRIGSPLYPFRHENGNLYFNPRPEGGSSSGTERVLVSVKDPIPPKEVNSSRPGLPDIV